MLETEGIRKYREACFARWFNEGLSGTSLPPVEKPPEYDEWVKSLHAPKVGLDGPDDPRIAVWYGDSFIIDDTFNSTDELRELADIIDKWRSGS